MGVFRILFCISTIVLFGACAVTTAQVQNLDAEARDATIRGVVQLLKEKYAYPEIAAKMEAAVVEHTKSGNYDSLTEGRLFAERITADLRKVFDDKHLKLSYSEKPIPERSGAAGQPTEAEIEAARLRQTRENFGVIKVEILKGNIGYLQINYFAPLGWASDTYAATFAYLANTDAMIIDVRRNSGSMDINTIPFFCSYLFDAPVMIGDIASRTAGEPRQLWTYAKVPGSKYTSKPVFVLTGAKTASGAEGFVSALKRLGRATLVGETTAGATMPGRSHRVNEHFSIWISTGRASGSKAESENKGVPPDIEADQASALSVAHLRLIEQLAKKASDNEWKAELERLKATIAAQ